MKALRKGAVTLAVVAAAGLTAPAAQAATAPPHLTDGFGLVVASQPAWVDEGERTFTFTVKSDQVPTYTVLPGQVPDEHVIMVTLPEGYDGTTRYPVHYTFHGHQDYPNSVRQKEINEKSTAGVPLITVTPNGGGRGWYSNWINPPDYLGKQNWEAFHLDQLIPFVDANLSTIPTRAGRAISGHSMGGFGAFHYAEHRPELFSYVGSFSGGLDLLSPEMRAVVVATEEMPTSGTPIVPIDAIFGLPVWPFDGVWNAQSPAQHVEPLRGMGIIMYTGDGGNLAVNPTQALVENRARETAVVTSDYLTAAGIPHDFVDYGDGSTWAPGCTGKHSEQPCLQADMDHFVGLLMARLEHP
jgi:S-formylglutathione hydrolase FrmB